MTATANQTLTLQGVTCLNLGCKQKYVFCRPGKCHRVLAASVSGCLIPGVGCEIAASLVSGAEAAEGSLPSCTVPARVCRSAGEVLCLQPCTAIQCRVLAVHSRFLWPCENPAWEKCASQWPFQCYWPLGFTSCSFLSASRAVITSGCKRCTRRAAEVQMGVSRDLSQERSTA